MARRYTRRREVLVPGKMRNLIARLSGKAVFLTLLVVVFVSAAVCRMVEADANFVDFSSIKAAEQKRRRAKNTTADRSAESWFERMTGIKSISFSNYTAERGKTEIQSMSTPTCLGDHTDLAYKSNQRGSVAHSFSTTQTGVKDIYTNYLGRAEKVTARRLAAQEAQSGARGKQTQMDMGSKTTFKESVKSARTDDPLPRANSETEKAESSAPETGEKRLIAHVSTEPFSGVAHRESQIVSNEKPISSSPSSIEALSPQQHSRAASTVEDTQYKTSEPPFNKGHKVLLEEGAGTVSSSSNSAERKIDSVALPGLSSKHVPPGTQKKPKLNFEEGGVRTAPTSPWFRRGQRSCSDSSTVNTIPSHLHTQTFVASTSPPLASTTALQAAAATSGVDVSKYFMPEHIRSRVSKILSIMLRDQMLHYGPQEGHNQWHQIPAWWRTEHDLTSPALLSFSPPLPKQQQEPLQEMQMSSLQGQQQQQLRTAAERAKDSEYPLKHPGWPQRTLGDNRAVSEQTAIWGRIGRELRELELMYEQQQKSEKQAKEGLASSWNALEAARTASSLQSPVVDKAGWPGTKSSPSDVHQEQSQHMKGAFRRQLQQQRSSEYFVSKDAASPSQQQHEQGQQAHLHWPTPTGAGPARATLHTMPQQLLDERKTSDGEISKIVLEEEQLPIFLKSILERARRGQDLFPVELEASLHPDLQKKLRKMLEEMREDLYVQAIMETPAATAAALQAVAPSQNESATPSLNAITTSPPGAEWKSVPRVERVSSSQQQQLQEEQHRFHHIAPKSGGETSAEIAEAAATGLHSSQTLQKPSTTATFPSVTPIPSSLPLDPKQDEARIQEMRKQLQEATRLWQQHEIVSAMPPEKHTIPPTARQSEQQPQQASTTTATGAWSRQAGANSAPLDSKSSVTAANMGPTRERATELPSQPVRSDPGAAAAIARTTDYAPRHIVSSTSPAAGSPTSQHERDKLISASIVDTSETAAAAHSNIRGREPLPRAVPSAGSYEARLDSLAAPATPPARAAEKPSIPAVSAVAVYSLPREAVSSGAFPVQSSMLQHEEKIFSVPPSAAEVAAARTSVHPSSTGNASLGQPIQLVAAAERANMQSFSFSPSQQEQMQRQQQQLHMLQHQHHHQQVVQQQRPMSPQPLQQPPLRHKMDQGFWPTAHPSQPPRPETANTVLISPGTAATGGPPWHATSSAAPIVPPANAYGNTEQAPHAHTEDENEENLRKRHTLTHTTLSSPAPGVQSPTSGGGLIPSPLPSFYPLYDRETHSVTEVEPDVVRAHSPHVQPPLVHWPPSAAADSFAPLPLPLATQSRSASTSPSPFAASPAPNPAEFAAPAARQALGNAATAATALPTLAHSADQFLTAASSLIGAGSAVARSLPIDEAVMLGQRLNEARMRRKEGPPSPEFGNPTVRCMSSGMSCCVPQQAVGLDWRKKPPVLNDSSPDDKACQAHFIPMQNSFCAATEYEGSACGIQLIETSTHKIYKHVLHVRGLKRLDAICECHWKQTPGEFENGEKAEATADGTPRVAPRAPGFSVQSVATWSYSKKAMEEGRQAREKNNKLVSGLGAALKATALLADQGAPVAHASLRSVEQARGDPAEQAKKAKEGMLAIADMLISKAPEKTNPAMKFVKQALDDMSTVSRKSKSG